MKVNTGLDVGVVMICFGALVFALGIIVTNGRLRKLNVQADLEQRNERHKHIIFWGTVAIVFSAVVALLGVLSVVHYG